MVLHSTDQLAILRAMLTWDDMIYISDPALDFELNLKIDSLCKIIPQDDLSEEEKEYLIKSRSYALNNLGNLYTHKGKYHQAISYFQQSLAIDQEKGYQLSIANAYNNMALVYKKQGKYAKAIELQTKGLKIREAINYQQGIAHSLHNIGSIYKAQGDYSTATNYFKRSLIIEKELNNQEGIASSYNVIGEMFKQQEQLDSAQLYISRGLEIRKSIGDKEGISNSLLDLGNLEFKQEKYGQALAYYQESLEQLNGLEVPSNKANCLHNMALVYQARGAYSQALKLAVHAFGLAESVGQLELVSDIAKTLSSLYKEQGNTRLALQYYERHIQSRDSLESERNKREVIRQAYKYEYEKQASADSIKNAEAKKLTDAQLTAQKAQLEKEETQRYALFWGLGLLALFGGVMYNRFRLTKQQRDIIEEQKNLVEDQKIEVEEAHNQLSVKNQEILDSIVYAKRIQTAILPPIRLVKEYLQNSFIYYQPKDVVAGDFYWMETVGKIVYFAAADCTGHGVPGAMVSVICVNGLNRAVREFELRDPAKILDKTRELVIKEFEKSEEEVKDGMDISLCALNLKNNELHWSGANNPLWIVRLGSDEIEEIKANKQPIGQFDLAKSFTSHVVQLNQGDTLYIFSDGFPDQFGGEKGKKYKSGKFKRTLVELSKQDISTQKQLLKNEFEDWKGENEQLDDVCIIGVKI